MTTVDKNKVYNSGDYKSLSDAQRLANETAAYVCSCKGAMPL